MLIDELTVSITSNRVAIHFFLSLDVSCCYSFFHFHWMYVRIFIGDVWWICLFGFSEGTNFDQLNITVMPKLGRALVWPSVRNIEPNKKDWRTTHQALPVESGIKFGGAYPRFEQLYTLLCQMFAL